MKTLAAAAALAVVAVLTACGSGTPAPRPGASAGSCKQAEMQQISYSENHRGSGYNPPLPASCHGLPPAVLRAVTKSAVKLELAKYMAAHHG